jgi:3-hydroxyisobutyrate dehydrogenase-like beta-hydroxyacid dehydrogenase
MMTDTIAIVGTGDMGSAVGAAFVRQGYRVVTDLTGRSTHSRGLAGRAGIEDVGSLQAVATQAGLILSILPPACAPEFAGLAVAAIEAAATSPVFVDCNAIAPATVRALAALFERSAATFVDAGIVGPAPRSGAATPTRCYVSGAARGSLLELSVPELRMIDMGADVGRASAIKMTYAAMNKGVDALYTAVLMAAEQLGVRGELMDEFRSSQAREFERMTARIPYLAATAARYTGEMREIAATFAAADVSPDFHRGAEWVYAQLAQTPFASETRATLPEQRSLDEAIGVFCASLGRP